MNLTLEEACEKYKLSAEEQKRIGKIINNFMLSGKTPVESPIAIINIAPPGSGKTGLNGLGLGQFENRNVIIINSDELKPFHPKAEEIAKLYPEYYTKVTNPDSNAWTDNLFAEATSRNFNIIFEGTGRNLKLLQSMIEQMSNYKVIVRGMAVDELNCLMSIVERYEGQLKEKGWGRLVTISRFYKAYDEMLDTIHNIENMGIVDSVEVYIRGERPEAAVKIYTTETKEFSNARIAVIEGRKKDRVKAKKYFEGTFNESTSRKNRKENFLEETEILDKIYSVFEEERGTEDAR